jgi:S1-C subfamily serine protease
MTSPFPPEPRGFEGVEPERPVGRRSDPWAIAFGILGGVLLGTGVTFAILGFVGVFEEPTPPTIPSAPVLTAPTATAPPPTFGDNASVASVASRVIPSIVAVNTSSLLQSGGGSGVVYGEDGYILTNHHVIEGSSDISVIFADGARFPAEVVGSDPVTDVGVLLVQRQDLTPVAVGSADALSIGEPAVAVGNPLGLEGGPTVTTGIVSALDRRLAASGGETLYGLVQTDAPIAPGSSGGALVDAAGRLIGITTAIAVSDVGAEGLGFAVPIDIAVGVANDLIENGAVEHALLGIVGETAWASENGAEFPVGVLVTEVAPDSAYDEAEGQINDVIVAIDDIEVRTIESLLGRLRRLRAGDIVPVRILRGDAEATIDVTMGELEP